MKGGDCTSVIRKLAEGALNPTIHVTDKGIKWSGFHYWSLRETTCHFSPLQTLTHWPLLFAIIKTIPHPPSGLSIKSMSFWFRDQDVMGNNIKCFAQLQVGNISCYSLVHQCCSLSQWPPDLLGMTCLWWSYASYHKLPPWFVPDHAVWLS